MAWRRRWWHERHDDATGAGAGSPQPSAGQPSPAACEGQAQTGSRQGVVGVGATRGGAVDDLGRSGHVVAETIGGVAADGHSGHERLAVASADQVRRGPEGPTRAEGARVCPQGRDVNRGVVVSIPGSIFCGDSR